MKIISKFHDYYDTCLMYGADPGCLYKRNTTEYDQGKSPITIDLMNGISFDVRDYRRANGNTGVVWFCGQSFPFIILHKPYQSSCFFNEVPTKQTQDVYYCYSKEEVEKTLPLVLDKTEVKRYFNPSKQKYRYFFAKGSTKEQVESFFTETKFDTNHIVKTLCDLGAPCLMYRNNKLTTNPMLKDMQFYKVKDAFTAYQDISMFISGVMGGQSPPMIPISDEIRKSKHGFDEWSFRKKVR